MVSFHFLMGFQPLRLKYCVPVLFTWNFKMSAISGLLAVPAQAILPLKPLLKTGAPGFIFPTQKYSGVLMWIS